MSEVLGRHGLIVTWVTMLFGGIALAGVRRLLLGAGPWRQFLLYLLVPVVLTLVLSWQNAKAFNVRYVLFSMPAYICLLALGLDSLAARTRYVALALLFATAGFSLGNHFFDGRYAREDVRAAVREVERHIAPGDCVIVPTVFEVFEHYFTHSNPVRPIYASQRIPQSSVDEQLATAIADCSDVWYVRARPWVNDPDAYLVRSLDESLTRVELVEFSGVELYRYTSGHSQQ